MAFRFSYPWINRTNQESLSAIYKLDTDEKTGWICYESGRQDVRERLDISSSRNQ